MLGKKLALVLALTTVITATHVNAYDNASQTAQSQSGNLQLGKEWYKTVQADYAAGKYKDFLKQVQDVFNDAETQQQLQSVQKAYQEYLAQEAQMKPLLNEFRTKTKALREARNAQLKKACTGHESEKTCAIVTQVITPDSLSLEDDQVQSDELAGDPDKKEFDKLQLEGMIKQRIAEQLALQGGINVNNDLLDKQLLAVQMELMDKYKAFSAAHGKTPVGKYINDVAEKFAARIALAHDLSYLRTVGTTSSATPVDIEVSKIMENYLNQVGELTRNTFQKAEGEKKN